MTPPPEQPTPTSDQIIANAWQEAYKQADELRRLYPDSTVRIAEITENVVDDRDVHHLVVVEESSMDVAIIRTMMDGVGGSRFLQLPGAVVKAMQIK